QLETGDLGELAGGECRQDMASHHRLHVRVSLLQQPALRSSPEGDRRATSLQFSLTGLGPLLRLPAGRKDARFTLAGDVDVRPPALPVPNDARQCVILRAPVRGRVRNGWRAAAFSADSGGQSIAGNQW